MAKFTRTDKATIISVGQSIEAFVKIGAAMVLSRLLSKTDYGLYHQVWLVFLIGRPLFRSGFRPGIFYFWPKAGFEGRKELILQNLFLHAASGLIFSALIFFGAPLIAGLAKGGEALVVPLRCFSLFPLLALPSLAADPVLLSADRPVLLVVTTVISRSAPFGICLVGLGALGWSLTTTFLAVVIGAAVLLIGTTWITLLPAAGSPFRWRWRSVLEQVKFAIPMGIAPTVAELTLRASQLAVWVFYVPAVFAIYMNGSFQVPVFPILVISANSVIVPEMSVHAADGRIGPMMDVWQRAIRKIAFIIFPATAFLFVYARETILVFFSSKYLASVPIFMITLFLLPARAANFLLPLMLTKKTRAVAMGSVIGLVSVLVLCPALLLLFRLRSPAFGLLGAAAAIVLARLIWNGYFMLKIHQLLDIPYGKILPWKYLGTTALLAVVAAAVSLLPKLLGWQLLPGILAGGVVFGAVFVPLALLTNVFPPLERARLRKLLSRISGLRGRSQND
jgi:O-antigen/teichoic acid export membrane protein